MKYVDVRTLLDVAIVLIIFTIIYFSREGL